MAPLEVRHQLVLGTSGPVDQDRPGAVDCYVLEIVLIQGGVPASDGVRLAMNMSVRVGTLDVGAVHIRGVELEDLRLRWSIQTKT
jgi:hypothetical protein